MAGRKPVVRPARPSEIEAIVALCAEHAAYEGAAFSVEEDHKRLAHAIFDENPRLWCFVAEAEGTIVGYATCTKDFSTWRAEEYLHLDCLYTTADSRNAGIGTEMMDVILQHASALGCSTLEWQTPAWNANAIRFYRRFGAVGCNKVRFRWDPGISSSGGAQ
jgi:GNAT superfamily N-acetyltransferase